MPTLKLFHPTDPRYLIFPVAPDKMSNTDVFAGLFGRMLTVCIGEPEATYDRVGDEWVKRQSNTGEEGTTRELA